MKNKFKVKSLNSGTLSKTLTAGVLACVLSCGVNVNRVEASFTIVSGQSILNNYGETIKLANYGYSGGPNGEIYHFSPFFVSRNNATGELDFFVTTSHGSGEGEDINLYTSTPPVSVYSSENYYKVGSISGDGSGGSYTAGNGITISSDNKVYV